MGSWRVNQITGWPGEDDGVRDASPNSEGWSPPTDTGSDYSDWGSPPGIDSDYGGWGPLPDDDSMSN